MNNSMDIATKIAENASVKLAISALMESIRDAAIQEGCSPDQAMNAIDRGNPVVGMGSLDELISFEIAIRFVGVDEPLAAKWFQADRPIQPQRWRCS